MGGRANAPGGNIGGVGGAPLVVFGGVKFTQGIFTAIQQVVRNTLQTMQVMDRVVDSRATTAMKDSL